MHILVVGTGSIGQRHIKNLLEMGVQVSAFSYRQSTSLPHHLQEKVFLYDDLQVALNSGVDAVVIANSTDKHIEVALKAAELCKHLYIEKPISNSLFELDRLNHLIATKALVVECGFMLRFHPNLQWIREKLTSVELGEIMYVRACVGQWLPDWRPGSDYRQGYGAFKAKGGGVIFDLIHELDLVYWLAGPINDVSAMTRNVTCLEIETEAIAQIGLRLASGALAQIHLDYVRPSYERSMEIVCLNGVLSWDYTKGIVYHLEKGKQPFLAHKTSDHFDRNSMFKSHMGHFLDRIQMPNIKAASSFDDAVEVLRVALASHLSAINSRNIQIKEISL